MIDSNQVTDTSGITESDGHFLHDHPDIMANPAAKNALAKYKTADEAIMGGFHASVKLGEPHINIPGDDADDTVKAEFKGKLAKHLGKPDTIEGYTIARPDGATKENYNFAAEKAFLETAHNLDANQAQVEGMYDFHVKMIQAAIEQQKSDLTAKKAENELTLISDMGGKEKYIAGSELNARLFETFFGTETAAAIDASGLGNDVGFWKGINKLADMAVAEGRQLTASKQTGKKKAGALAYPKMAERAAEAANG